MEEIALYKELIEFCNSHQDDIETKFKRSLSFSELNEKCYVEMFLKCRNIDAPLAPKHFKEIIPGLTEMYRSESIHFLRKRNEYIKGLDIQKGNWYEKGLQLFLENKGFTIKKKGFPFPDFEVLKENEIIGYYELKYINSPFISANSSIKNTYPYNSTRFDYEASLTLDTGEKMSKQRAKIEENLFPTKKPVFYIWWFDCFHIKGIFGMLAKDVFDYYDHIGEDLLVRQKRDGDELSHQEIGKIYPPLLNMNTFSEILKIFNNA